MIWISRQLFFVCALIFSFTKRQSRKSDKTICPDFEPGDGIGRAEEKISSNLTGQPCIDACVSRKQRDNTINGVTIRRDGSGGCWCEKNMEGVSKAVESVRQCKTCFMGPDKTICPDFEPGDGIGRAEEKISKTLTGQPCIDACVNRKRRDNTINGVTILRNGSGGCWCEKNMEGVSKAVESVRQCKTCFMGPDVQECITSHMCDINASCSNARGSYNCTCNHGFGGNGFNCSDALHFRTLSKVGSRKVVVGVSVALGVVFVLVLTAVLGCKYRSRQGNDEEMTQGTPAALEARTSSTSSGTVASQMPVGPRMSLEGAGKCISEHHCKKFPHCKESFILPPVFVATINDAAEAQPRNGLSRKKRNCFVGMQRNKAGEMAEKAVFDAFNSLIRIEKVSDDFLLLRSFSFDSSSVGNLKIAELRCEFPSLDPSLDTRGEWDMLIFVKDVGVIIGEIKRIATPEQIRKAGEQVARGARIVECLMEAITNGTVTNFPIEKVIFFPEEGTPSPLPNTSDQIHHLHKDLCQDLFQKWEKIIEKLRQKKIANSFAFSDFERLMNVFIGVWSAKSINKGKKLELLEDEAEFRSLTKKVDDAVKQGKITSLNTGGNKALKSPITSVSSCLDSEVFRNSTGPTLFYLSPEQRDLFDNVPIAIVNGNAGSGKTLCLMFKVIDIYKNSTTAKILIVAPTPHDYRLDRILSDNKIDVERISKFPPPSPITPQSNPVYIISLDAFFVVSRKDLLAYPLHDYNLFFDDAQCYQRNGADESSFVDIADFLKQAETNAIASGFMLWFLIDAVQGALHASSDYSVNLFKQTSIKAIPVFTLKQVLRNTREIIGVAKEVRSEEINAKSRLKLEGIIPEFVEGHGITSLNILYHKLQRGTRSTGSEFDCTKQFMLERIKEEIKRITGGSSNGANSSDIAILFGLNQLNDYKSPLEEMLLDQFNAKTQTVLELERDGDNGGIVLDIVANTMSYESMCVLYVLTNNNYVYNLVTRARVILTVIDLMTDSPPIYSENIDLVKWEDDGNSFVKYQ